MKSLLLALYISAGADAASTCVGLNKGFEESNSFIYGKRPSCERVVATKALAVGVTHLAAVKLRKRHPKLAKWSLGIAVGTNSFAVTWNLYQLGR